MLIVFTLGLYFTYLAAENVIFVGYLQGLVLFFLADTLSIVNILCINSKISNSKKEYRQMYPDGTPVGGISFMYNTQNSNTDKSTEKENSISNSKVIDIDRSEWFQNDNLFDMSQNDSNLRLQSVYNKQR